MARTTQSSGGSDDRGWVGRALLRMRAEYVEMPGLCLTADQAARLLGLQSHECCALLNGLVDVGFLRRTPDGHYVRA